jgi:hypothetical protein
MEVGSHLINRVTVKKEVMPLASCSNSPSTSVRLKRIDLMKNVTAYYSVKQIIKMKSLLYITYDAKYMPIYKLLLSSLYMLLKANLDGFCVPVATTYNVDTIKNYTKNKKKSNF